jgi:septal ring factor EnvC (AmiA/AmiB activator)
MAGTIAKTHLLNLKQTTDRIIELEKIKNKSVQQKQELKKLKSNLIELKKDVQKAENIVITAQASNEEIERYIYLVNN